VTGPFFVKIKAMSVFEYFELRFGSKRVRLVGMACYVIRTIFATSLYIYGPGSALIALTNLDEKISITIIGLIATLYTAIGGIKAVIWTDFYQTIIMIASLVIIVAKGLYDIGGFANMWQINLYGGRLQLFDFNPDPFIRQSFWSQTIGYIFVLSLFYSVDQQMIQRFFASKNKKTAGAERQLPGSAWYNIIKPTFPQLLQITEYCNQTDNLTTKEIYESYFEETIIEVNKLNSTIFNHFNQSFNHLF
jgi:Na+/proline symporter